MVIVLAVLFIAAIVQKLTGMGFALVATPVLVLLWGPTEGVLLTVFGGLIISLLMLRSGYRMLNWRHIGVILLGGVIGAPLGAWIARVLSEPWLLVIVGAAGVIALVLPYVSPAQSEARGGVVSGVVTGVASSFMHLTSGLSGPPLVAYGERSRWEHLSFVASIQVVFVVFAGTTMVLRGLPSATPTEFGLIAAVVLAGLIVGTVLHRLVPVKWARRGMFTVAWIGALTVLYRGIAAFL